jgi:6-phosphogluconolactonase
MDTVNHTINIFANADDLFQAAANDFRERAIAMVEKKGKFNVALSGGNTPKTFFPILSSLQDIPWAEITFFFCDERYVPSSSVENNYHMANHFLFTKVSVNPKNIYRIATDFPDPLESARQYEQLLKEHARQADESLFDLVYLGLGNDAHTASLMPYSDIVKYYANQTSFHENDPLVVSLWVPELNMYRITLTPNALKNSAAIIFIVLGHAKQNAIQAVLRGPCDPIRFPAQLIQSSPDDKIIWFLDEAAASLITDKS